MSQLPTKLKRITQVLKKKCCLLCNFKAVFIHVALYQHPCLDQPEDFYFDDLKTQHVLHWQNKMDDFSHWLHYIEDTENILADNMSRLLYLPTSSQVTEGKKII